MRTEVCVVAYESADTVPALVRSLSLLGDDVGLAVHDNGPGAATLPVAQQAAEEVGIAFRGEECERGNCGFASGCNALARSSAADDLLFLNPDARVLAWPPALRAASRVVGAVIQDSRGGEAFSYGAGRMLRDELALRWLRRKPVKPRGRGYVSGAALLVAREDFLGLGGFDEGFFMYYEDIDLCHRAAHAGLPVVVEEGWRVEHVGGHSVGRSAAGLRAAHLRSYRSGRRYHQLAGHPVRGYDLLCLVDAAGRAVLRAPFASGRPQAAADWAVARAAAHALVGGQRRTT